jgi:ATP-dependent Clp protease ATP-binding subunit ClpC
VREQVVKLIGRGDGSEWPNIELTPRSRRVLALAVDHVQRHGHVRVGTEHLLLGLALEAQGVAAGMLERFGANLVQLRQRQLTTLSQLE